MKGSSMSISEEVLLKQSVKSYKVKIGDSLTAWCFGTMEAALQSAQNAGWGNAHLQIIEYETTKTERVVYDSRKPSS